MGLEVTRPVCELVNATVYFQPHFAAFTIVRRHLAAFDEFQNGSSAIVLYKVGGWPAFQCLEQKCAASYALSGGYVAPEYCKRLSQKGAVAELYQGGHL